jgi:Zn finger protein HypA/HybF involved in hydrogenase expression
MDDFRVKCKKCGRPAKPNEFVLDAEFRMMVCPNCIREKRAKHEVYAELNAMKQAKKAAEGEERKEEKPLGWDHEDDILEKAAKMKLKNSVKVEQIDDNHVKYSCPKCKYKFAYDTVRKMPKNCPYCSSELFKMMY